MNNQNSSRNLMEAQNSPTVAQNTTNTSQSTIERLRHAVNASFSRKKENPLLDDLDRHIRSIHLPTGLTSLIMPNSTTTPTSNGVRSPASEPGNLNNPTNSSPFLTSNIPNTAPHSGSTVIDIDPPMQQQQQDTSFYSHGHQSPGGGASASALLVRRRSASPSAEGQSPGGGTSGPSSDAWQVAAKCPSESTIDFSRAKYDYKPVNRTPKQRSASTASQPLRLNRRNSNNGLAHPDYGTSLDGDRLNHRSASSTAPKRSSNNTRTINVGAGPSSNGGPISRRHGSSGESGGGDTAAENNTTEGAENGGIGENARASTESGGAGGGGGGEDTDVPQNVRELRQRIRTLFADRRALLRRFLDCLGAFPSLYLFATLCFISFLLVIGIFHFLELYGFYLLVLIFSFAHYSDSARFVRGGFNLYLPCFIIVRYAFIIYVCQHWFIFHTAIYQPADFYLPERVNKTQQLEDIVQFTDLTKRTTDEPPSNELIGATKLTDDTLKSSSERPILEERDVEKHNKNMEIFTEFLNYQKMASKNKEKEKPSTSFFLSLYIVTITELFIMDVALLVKFLVSNVPFFPMAHKRRVYQWIEYTCALYRFPIPYAQWLYYFGGSVLTPLAMLYTIVKMPFILGLACLWLRTTWYLFSHSHLGTKPTEAEVRNEERCSICHCDFTAPIKLNCGHIFCTEDIRTWLDKEITCPVCRAVVTKEDNKFRNGESMFPLYFF